jgi:hypothetical protein
MYYCLGKENERMKNNTRIDAAKGISLMNNCLLFSLTENNIKVDRNNYFFTYSR